MHPDIVHALNSLNRAFYASAAASFDESRGRPWPGWRHLLTLIPFPARVLDAGCGNGRFGVFLSQQAGDRLVRYHGLDSAEALVRQAQSVLGQRAGIQAQVDVTDLLTGPLPTATYDLVTCFGVLHHIPGTEQRQRLIGQLAQRVAPGGCLVFTTWRFYEYARFRERIVPWPPELAAEIEPHDHLLDWRRGSPDAAVPLRYCHYIDDAEQSALSRAAGLPLLAAYRADGHSGDMNGYTVLQRS